MGGVVFGGLLDSQVVQSSYAPHEEGIIAGQLPLQLGDHRVAVRLVDDTAAAFLSAVRRGSSTPQYATLPNNSRVDRIRKRKVCDA